MNKETFLRQLSGALSGCSKSDRKKSLSYYGELIEDYKENGMSEEEAIAALGNPVVIASDILEDYRDVHRTCIGMKVLIGVLLVLGFPLWGSLVLAAVLLLLSAYILLWCVPLICGSITVAALIMAVVSIPGSFAVLGQSFPLGVMQLGLGTICSGVFVLGALVTVLLCKWFAKLTKALTLHVIRWFRKEAKLA